MTLLLVLLACGYSDDGSIIRAECAEYRIEVDPSIMCHLYQAAIPLWEAEHNLKVIRWGCENGG